jgi:serine/threonine protein kinase
MCDCPAETLASLILAAVRKYPGLHAGTVRKTLGNERVCLIHFCGTLLALARKDMIRSGDPDLPIRVGMKPDDLSDVPLHAGSANPTPSLNRRIDVLGDLLEDPPGEAGGSPGNMRVLDGRFRVFLDQVLGRGGTATVYRGEQISLGRRVAVKIVPLDRLHPSVSRASYIERFEREPRVLGSLNHPHIVQVIDGGRDGERLWNVMEFLEGGTLADRVEREGPLPAPIILDYMLSLAEALGAAAGHGIQHRDVKPENIFNAGMKLADFGLAKVIQPEGMARRSDLTRPGSVMGTLPYIAPERANLESGDERSDIYSLGATMYYAATGLYLYEKQNPERAEWLHLHLNEEPVPIGNRSPGFPPELGKVIHRCLAKRASDREPSSDSLADSLRKLMPVIFRSRTRVMSPNRGERPAPQNSPPEVALAPAAAGNAAVSVSVILSNMDLEVLKLFGAYEERYGSGCWAIDPSFQRVLWRLAENAGMQNLCARIGGVPKADLKESIESYLSAAETGTGDAPKVSSDIRDYVWQALRQAGEQNSSGFVADADPAEALIQFLRRVQDDESLMPYRVPEAIRSTDRRA